jgi:Spy/CpxP family protein refolding chaperone
MGSAALPPEKREAIRRIQSDYAERLFRLRQDVRSKQAELNAIMLKPQPDTVKAKSTVRDIARLQTQEADTLIDMHARISLETDVRLPMLPAGPGAVQMKKE